MKFQNLFLKFLFLFLYFTDMASFVSFDPLSLSQVNIPPNGTFVIARSMVTKNKAASNDFNSRVVECRLASLIIAKKKGLQNWSSCVKLAKVQDMLSYKLEEMIQVTEELFHDGYYSKSEVCDILGLSNAELEDKFLTDNTKHLNEFKLKPRALHVYKEALRTECFQTISTTTKSLQDLGILMFESHRSLKDLYECSHPELDKLVTISKENGALGARLTGAGWGGCMVALVYSDQVHSFVKNMQLFYENKLTSGESIENCIFISKASQGASVIAASALYS